MFYNNDNTYSFAIEISPLGSTGLATFSIALEFISKLPENIFLQVHYFGSKDLEDELQAFRKEHNVRENMATPDAEIIKKSMDEMVKFFREKTQKSCSASMKTTIKKIKIMISASAMDKDNQKDLFKFQRSLYDILLTNNFNPQYVTPQSLLRFNYELLNPHIPPSDFVDYDKNLLTNKQMISLNTKFFVDDNFFKIGNKYWINSTPISYSEEAHLTEFNKKLGDYLSDSLNTTASPLDNNTTRFLGD